jgi:signal transduction histidine kinase
MIAAQQMRVLFVEDSPGDAELIEVYLDEIGYDLVTTRVETAAALDDALDRGRWDVILSDYTLPQFSAPLALAQIQRRGVDVPFIVVSGTIGEERASDLMLAGAHGFILKGDLVRLGPSIVRERREADNRRLRREAEGDRERLVLELKTTVSESARLNAIAVEANRAKDEFLAMLGHELRNPLAPIVTAMEIIRLRTKGPPSHEHVIIERQVAHLVRLVGDLLDVAKITRGNVELKKTRVDLAKIVAQAVEIADPILEQRRHHVEIHVPEGIALNADGGRLVQVISNLLTNAARYTPPGGHIRLDATREGDDAVLRLKDDGIGIEAEILPKIFDLFVQASQTAGREGGLGLGSRSSTISC